MPTFELIATCAAGIESLVNQELKALGYHTQSENGRIRFEGGYAAIAETNIKLRTADRIKIVMGEFPATSFDALYEQTKAIAWEQWLPMDAEFPVSGKAIKSKLHATPTVQKMVKKAIVDRLNTYYHHHGHLPESGAHYAIDVRLYKDKASITLDTSGDSLFKRGYRQEKGGAPLKENLAAALVDLTTWHADRPFYDPTTGSGTIAIEAAMKGMNIAPGLKRSFICEEWDIFTDEFQTARKQAEADIDHEVQLDILACDIDHRMIDIAKENAKAAGVAHQIEFKQMQVADFTTDKSFGIIVSNPPYGERLKDRKYAHALYQQMGDLYRALPTWSKYILTSDPDFETYYGEKATKKRKLYNGALRTDYYQYWGKRH
ncbi:MAG: class I SAM-dependent RNA methyltransferase [Aerococcus sp.]|nr:class I SAM-dependent RNA methyltransferase [Aerococcus sp.]